MRQSITPETNLTLNEVKKHFDHWRSTRQKRGRIPNSLWHEVKALTGRYSLTQITQALGINTNQIALGLNQKTNITFVEATKPTHQVSSINNLPPITLTKGGHVCSIEIHRANGGALKISEFPVGSLSNLINQFME